MKLSDFDFFLPDDLIADRPARPRDHARLLLVPPSGPFEDRTVKDLPNILRPGDILVFNDTRVIPARLYGIRQARSHGGSSGAKIEILLHQSIGDEWLAFARPAKRLSQSDEIQFGHGLVGKIVMPPCNGEVRILFNLIGGDLVQVLEQCGHVPLPPYILSKREEDKQDRLDYQTVYADKPGSVAAPTAGLHFTPELLDALDNKGIERTHVTLHVGAGTFIPVKTDDISQHRMHSEWGLITPQAADKINATRLKGGRVIAVGTTSLRLIEAAASEDGKILPFHARTDIFITPGYRFRIADAIMTNFHLPKSTLFMLIAAFIGLEQAHKTYAHAIAQGYRFYSYGDSSLWFRKP